VSLAGNYRLAEIVSKLNDQVRRARTITLKLRISLAKSNEDHQKLYRAVMNGDSAQARELLVQHRQRAAGSLIELLQQMGLKRI